MFMELYGYLKILWMFMDICQNEESILRTIGGYKKAWYAPG